MFVKNMSFILAPNNIRAIQLPASTKGVVIKIGSIGTSTVNFIFESSIDFESPLTAVIPDVDTEATLQYYNICNDEQINITFQNDANSVDNAKIYITFSDGYINADLRP